MPRINTARIPTVRTSATPVPTLALLTLAATAFVYVTAETLPVGLLPEMSADLGVSESSIGLLLTFYAYAVALVTLPLMRVVNTWDRRTVVIATAVALAVSQLISAVAVGYPMLVAARMLCAATHGVFWAVVAPVAASLAPGREGKALAMVYAGTSLALVAGNPLSSAIGQWLGWRTAAATLGVVALLITVALVRGLPALPSAAATPQQRSDTEHRPTLFTPLLVILCLATFLAVLGHFAGYTYFSLLVGATVGGSGATLSLMLFVYGLAGVAGIWLIGRTHDRAPWRATVVVLTTVAVALAIMLVGVIAGLGAAGVIAIVLWGMAFTTIPVCLQSAVLRASPRNADTASAVYVVTFQVGIASGALIGGGLVDTVGIAWVLVAALALVGSALAVVVASRKIFPPMPTRTVVTSSASALH